MEHLFYSIATMTITNGILLSHGLKILLSSFLVDYYRSVS